MPSKKSPIPIDGEPMSKKEENKEAGQLRPCAPVKKSILVFICDKLY